MRKSHNKLSVEDWVSRARVHFGDTYTYDLASFSGTMRPVRIECPVHGWFSQRAGVHAKGQGCKKCGTARTTSVSTFTFEDFVLKARSVHGATYEYDPASYTKTMRKTRIKCSHHGWFEQSPNKHFSGQGCPLCSNKKRNVKTTLTPETFEARASAVHVGKYAYHQDYISYHKKIAVTCPTHGLFHVAPSKHEFDKSGCPKCANQQSRGETEVADFLSQFTQVTTRDRSIIAPLELDIVLPDLNLAIEYNGLYWHSDKFPDARTRHLKKSAAAASAGYRLIHIFEDEWLTSRAAVENLLRHVVGHSAKLGGARSFSVRVSPLGDVKKFLDVHHVQGAPRGGTAYSLVDDAGVVQATMVFAKVTSERGAVDVGYELTRFASSGSISGSASRLFKAFVLESGASRVISYSDCRMFSGAMYSALGFKETHTTPPNYYVVRDGIRAHKSNFRKSRLAKLLPDYDVAKTEKQMCHENEWFRVYDCGLTKWVWVA